MSNKTRQKIEADLLEHFKEKHPRIDAIEIEFDGPHAIIAVTLYPTPKRATTRFLEVSGRFMLKPDDPVLNSAIDNILDKVDRERAKYRQNQVEARQKVHDRWRKSPKAKEERKKYYNKRKKIVAEQRKKEREARKLRPFDMVYERRKMKHAPGTLEIGCIWALDLDGSGVKKLWRLAYKSTTNGWRGWLKFQPDVKEE